MPSSLAGRIALGVLALLVLAVGVLFADANLLRHPIERFVTDKTGRALAIDGDLRLSLDPHLVVQAEGLRYANPEWAAGPEMLNLPRVRASIAWLPLFTGRLVLLEANLEKPVIDLERRKDLSNNWSLDTAQPPAPDRRGGLPEIRTLTVDEGMLMLADEPTQTFIKLTVQTESEGTHFVAQGKYAGLPLEADGRGGSILSLTDETQPFPLRGDATIGKTHAHVDGTITGLATLAAADLQMTANGESFDELFPIIHVAIPPSPPWKIKGRVIRDGEWWRLHDFEGHLGDSDLSGSADMAYRNERATVHAQITSRVLDLDDIGGFIGAKPQAGPGETASPEQRVEKAQAQAEPNLLPDVPIRLERLRAMDADVTFKGESIRGKAPLDGLDTHIVVKDGVLTLKPLNFGVGGGNVVATLVFDGRGDTAAVDSNIEFRRIRLSKLFPGNKTVAKATGLLGGRAELKGQGDSFASVLEHSNGRVGLAMSGGTISNLLLELAGLDVAESLRLLFTGDKPVTLRCAVADLDVQDGVVKSRSTVVDTTDTNLKIDGQVAFAGEELDLTVHPLPKDYSPAALRSPLHIHGTFKKPAVRVDKKLLARGGIAAILATIAPPVAALVALIETGPGDDADCEHLIASVEGHVGEKVPEAEPSR